jgi:lysophospholipase L1-like esterase
MQKMFAHALAGMTLLVSASAAADQPNTAVNFAFGGAQSGDTNLTAAFDPVLAAALQNSTLPFPGLLQQLDLAEATVPEYKPNGEQKALKHDVFWIYIGTNDMIGLALSLTATPPEAWEAVISGATANLLGNVGAAMERAHEMGARTIVVPNLMPTGNLPILSVFGLPPFFLDLMNNVTAGYNQALLGVIAGFEAAHPGAHVVPVDVAAIVTSLGEGWDTVNVCPAPPGGSCDGYLFGDIVHPTSGVYELWAQAAAEGLDEVMPRRVHRVVTLGDSFSDTGAMFATYTTLLPGMVPGFTRFTDGRFSDGANVIDYLEDLLNAKYPSTPAFLP